MALVTNNGSILPLAGVSTTSTGKFAPTGDGLTALIQAVTLTDQTGAAVTIGGSGTGSNQVQGAGASGAASVGNPVGVGGVYNTSIPTYTAGQRTDAQSDSRGNLKVALFGNSATTGVDVTGFSADALSTGANGLNVIAQGYGFNGTTRDRFRTITGTDGTGLGVQSVEQAGSSFANITSATTTTVKSGTGTFHKLIINTPIASATITIYNNTAGSGTKIGTITLPSVITAEAPIFLVYDLWFSTGLTFVTSGATDLTVIYR